MLIAHFENYEIISNSVIILDRVLVNEDNIDFAIVADVLKLIFHLTKLNPLRQEELALNDGIPLMMRLCQIRKDDREELPQMKKVAMVTLCSLVLSGPKSRKKLQEYGGITIFI
jgi:hypothetical protein